MACCLMALSHLPNLFLTSYEWASLTFTWEQFHSDCLWFCTMSFKLQTHTPVANGCFYAPSPNPNYNPEWVEIVLQVCCSYPFYKLIMSVLAVKLVIFECPIDDKSTLVWCCQITSHHRRKCRPRSMSQYGVMKPQWVSQFDNITFDKMIH